MLNPSTSKFIPFFQIACLGRKGKNTFGRERLNTDVGKSRFTVPMERRCAGFDYDDSFINSVSHTTINVLLPAPYILLF